ncbi:MAG: glycosyltransferase [Ginsengibacter sp.]
MQHKEELLPLISVIIPTYNYRRFLLKAIDSVMQQTYPRIEIIVIDDGSTDGTMDVIPSHPSIKYFYQENKGLSAARNAGLNHSQGRYLVFLDADDWLEKDGLLLNYQLIKLHPDVAFVSGNYNFLRANTGKLQKITTDVNADHYKHFLQRNYVGMHAAVMFQRWALQLYKYDESLRACEDYDLYLRIARRYPVMHHQQCIATYYFHEEGVSHNYDAMIEALTVVMGRQAAFVSSADEQKAYAQGLLQWKDYHNLSGAPTFSKV